MFQSKLIEKEKDFMCKQKISTLEQLELKLQPIIQLKKNDDEKQECFLEIKVIYWDQNHILHLLSTTPLQIAVTKDKQIKYLKDGQILREDEIKDISKEPEIMTNFQQIKYLQWFGQYGQNNQKVGKWMASWKGVILKNVGGWYGQMQKYQQYSNDGKKQGQWVDLINNYWNLAQVYEAGEYVNDQRSGLWKQICNNNQIGEGDYNKQGMKNGKWLQVSKDYWQYSQITQNGQYINGKKIGRWDIFYQDYWNQNSKLLSGGSYDEEGDGVKIGMWVELDAMFTDGKQVTFNGEYKNGKKFGRWDMYYRYSSSYLFSKIGCGSYDEGGDGVKIGMWIELDNAFRDGNQIIQKGEYKNGNKVGRWEIEFMDEKWKICENSVGGSYDEGVKNGMWIELDEQFRELKQITHQGEYQNGKKVGRWDIWFYKQWNNESKFLIGGGVYDEGVKIGMWIELDEKFRIGKQITHQGEYKNGNKIGRWDILSYKKLKNKSKNLIGGGSFHEGIKIGKWIDLDEKFHEQNMVTHNGEYKNGYKVGLWNIECDKERLFSTIGGGSYVEGSQVVKIGKWIDLDENFWIDRQVTHYGQYKNGNKVGIWVKMIREFKKMDQGFIQDEKTNYDN